MTIRQLLNRIAQLAALVASLNQVYECGSISQAKRIAKAAIASAEGESK